MESRLMETNEVVGPSCRASRHGFRRLNQVSGTQRATVAWMSLRSKRDRPTICALLKRGELWAQACRIASVDAWEAGHSQRWSSPGFSCCVIAFWQRLVHQLSQILGTWLWLPKADASQSCTGQDICWVITVEVFLVQYCFVDREPSRLLLGQSPSVYAY